MISYMLVYQPKPLGPITGELQALLSLAILVISTFKFSYPHLTLRKGQRSNPTTPKDSQPMISYMLVYQPKPLGPITGELQALLSLTILVISTFKFSHPCLTLRKGQRSNPTTPKDSQPMISYMLVYQPKPLGPITGELQALLSLAIIV